MGTLKIITRMATNQPDIMVLDLQGDLNTEFASKLNLATDALMAKGKSKFVINLSQLNLISSVGIQSLLHIRNRALTEQGGMILCCFGPKIRKVFELLGLFELFIIVETEALAVAKLLENE